MPRAAAVFAIGPHHAARLVALLLAAVPWMLSPKLPAHASPAKMPAELAVKPHGSDGEDGTGPRRSAGEGAHRAGEGHRGPKDAAAERGCASSRRPSDYIRAFSDSRLTLSRVRIYHKNTMELLEAAPFIILNLDKVDFLYAREDGETEA